MNKNKIFLDTSSRSLLQAYPLLKYEKKHTFIMLMSFPVPLPVPLLLVSHSSKNFGPNLKVGEKLMKPVHKPKIVLDTSVNLSQSQSPFDFLLLPPQS